MRLQKSYVYDLTVIQKSSNKYLSIKFVLEPYSLMSFLRIPLEKTIKYIPGG